MTDPQSIQDPQCAQDPRFEPSLSFGGEFPDGIHSRNDGLLSLKDIEARLDVNYSRLQRLANVEGIGEYVGAVVVPGAKGARYEPRALEVFRRLLAASDAKELTPGTAVAWLKLNEVGKPLSANETAITEKPLSGYSLIEQGQVGFGAKLLSGVLAPITAVLQDLTGAIQGLRAERQERTPAAPPADRLLTAEEAAALLACNPRSVNRHVKEVLPRKWKESDVLRYIQQLEPKSPK